MDILLTGAEGFTGRHFTQQAEAEGHTVIPLKADLREPRALKQEIQALEFSHVVHLGAISFVGHGEALGFYDVNVLGTLHLLEALIETHKSPRVLLASSANVYGNAIHSPILETQVLAPVNHYAMSKVAMELLARNYLDRLDLFFTRPFNYTGPGQDLSFLIPKLVHHFQTRQPLIELGNLDVEREFNDVRMVCTAYLRLLDHGERAETYNVCSGIGHSLRSVITELGELSGHTIEVQVNPAFVRPNEIKRLVGHPTKLLACVGPLTFPRLNETLAWMLENQS